MNKTTTLIVALLCVAITFAQNNSINYKAVVKDINGNYVTNQTVSVQLTILEGITPSYVETHSVMTDNNGLLILDIGQGTPVTGTFAAVDWNADIHSLMTEIDITGGSNYADLGTTEFKSVPYAKYAMNALNVTNVEGLKRSQGPEDDYPGWSLDTGEFLDGGDIIGPELWSIDMMIHRDFIDGPDQSSSQPTGVTGWFSFAAGDDNAVLGGDAVSFGAKNYVEGMGSSTFGFANSAIGNHTLAHGALNDAFGEYSTALGYALKADAFHSMAIGRYNIGGGDASTWVDTDPVFEIGNGTDDASRSNAITILKNGTITAPSLEIEEITDAKALVTKEYADTMAGTGLEQITEGAATGWRLIGKDPTLYDDIGDNAVDLSGGGAAGASGLYSFALGINNAAKGDHSVVTGENSLAKGANSFAGGIGSSSIGINAFAFGEGTDANGNNSVALGLNTEAPSYAEMVFGANNTSYVPISANQWDLSDRLFVVGNGTSDANRSNAMTVLKSGKTTVNESTASDTDHAINGIKTHTGNSDAAGVYGENTVSPDFGFGVHGVGNSIGVYGQSDNLGLFGQSGGTSAGSHYGVYGFSAGMNTGTNYGVYGFASGAAINYAVYANGDIANTGGVIHASDRKLKTNISAVPNALQSILQLKPSTYSIAPQYVKSMNMSSKPQFGFIAQELQDVFPDLVSNNVHPGATKEDAPIEYLGVNYTAIIPILTAGMQEQQKQIAAQQNIIEAQQEAIDTLKKRLDAIEN